MAPRATGRPAAFFDLDKTIIAKSSTLAFSRSFQAGGLISRRAARLPEEPSSASVSVAPCRRWVTRLRGSAGGSRARTECRS